MAVEIPIFQKKRASYMNIFKIWFYYISSVLIKSKLKIKCFIIFQICNNFYKSKMAASKC